MRFTALTPPQDRALHEWQQGRPVGLKTAGERWRVWIIDGADQIPLSDEGQVLISGARAAALGLAAQPASLPLDPAGGQDMLRFLARAHAEADVQTLPAPAFAQDLIFLAKQGRLQPAFCLQPTQTLPEVCLEVADLTQSHTSPLIERISTVDLPIDLDGEELMTKALLFDGSSLREEVLVLHIGDPHSVSAPLVRLHSACLTGDVFGSLKCDCGPQLKQALIAMRAEGHGCLLYMPQEGRDTGLRNKLRAYALQAAGLDTIEADSTLGFGADERDFAFAAALLTLQGLEKIRLMTNNPDKVATLSAEGIEIVERVPVAIPAQAHNHAYLKTKAQKAGHKL